jgi:hypothetical protein
MKRIVIIFLIGCMGLTGLHARTAPASGELVWFGIDYSKVKLIGVRSHFSDLLDIQSRLFRSWNELFLVESEKYDLEKAFRTNDVKYQMDKAIDRSNSREMDGIVQTDPYKIEEGEVLDLLKEYTDPSVHATGALFVMETLDKLGERSTMWLAVFDISTGEVLHLERYSGKAGGFGFRNYWARCFYNVVKTLHISID